MKKIPISIQELITEIKEASEEETEHKEKHVLKRAARLIEGMYNDDRTVSI